MQRYGALGGRDAYAILDVSPMATVREIEQARRRLQLKHHPDRQGDPVESAAVNVAAEILLDAVTRADYDAFRTGRPVADPRAAAPSSDTAWAGAADGFRPGPPRSAPPPTPPGGYPGHPPRAYPPPAYPPPAQPAYPPPAGPGPAYPAPPTGSAMPPMPPMPPMPTPLMAKSSPSSSRVGLIIAASVGALLFLVCSCAMLMPSGGLR